MIHAASEATVELVAGKLAFLIDDREVARVFVTDGEAALVEAQWRTVALDFEPNGRDIGKRLVEKLRRVAVDADRAVAEQIIAIGHELAALTDVLKDDERQLHEMTCYLFNLTDEERRLVERSRT